MRLSLGAAMVAMRQDASLTGPASRNDFPSICFKIANFELIFEANVWSRPSAAPKRGRRPSAAALFWNHVCFKSTQNIVFRYVLTIFLNPGGVSGGLFWHSSGNLPNPRLCTFLSMFLVFSRDLPKSSILYVLSIFRDAGNLQSVAAMAEPKA